MRGSDSAASERANEIDKSFQLKARLGMDNTGYYNLPVVDAGRILPVEVTKCSLFDQEAWKPDNILSPGQIPFIKHMATCRSILAKKQLPPPLGSNMHSLQDWSSFKSSLLTQFLAGASDGVSLPLVGMMASYQRKYEDPGKHWQVQHGGSAARRSLSVHYGEDCVGVVGG